ncbi:MAG: GGDEF domain-containing protein [Acetobacteraceae bacterium]|nr:GGDEF domain-containing protein [Acetobacteraceae bacterium]
MTQITPLRPARRAALPPDALSGLLADLGAHEDAPGWRRDALARAEAMARAAAATILAQAERISRLERLALTDELTGLYNRRGIEGRLVERLAEARRHGEPGVLVYLDLNGLKRINDLHGHGAGDEAIRLVAAALRRGLRSSDCIGRLGGDEFAVVLARCPANAGLAKAARLAQAISRLVLLADGARIPLSASIGLAAFTGEETASELLAEADSAMYREKRISRRA